MTSSLDIDANKGIIIQWKCMVYYYWILICLEECNDIVYRNNVHWLVCSNNVYLSYHINWIYTYDYLLNTMMCLCTWYRIEGYIMLNNYIDVIYNQSCLIVLVCVEKLYNLITIQIKGLKDCFLHFWLCVWSPSYSNIGKPLLLL